MLHIAICDDERDFVQQLTELLNQYSKETGRDIKITAYYDGIELIEKYDPTIDLIFLDIQMKMVDGLHAAERIRQMDETVGIIFLTTLTQYGLEGYKYHATNYIIKPMKYVRLKSEMDKFVERSQKEDAPSLVITNDTGKYPASAIFLYLKVVLMSCRNTATASTLITMTVIVLLQDLQRVIRTFVLLKTTMLCISIRTISVGQEVFL